MKNMINKISNRIKKGDLAEVALTPDAIRLVFPEEHPFFVPDPERRTNIPGRTGAGYVVDIDSDASGDNYISLTDNWNKTRDKSEYDRTRYYFDALESCTKLRRFDLKKILGSAFSGFASIGKAYGSLSL
jgi:hypothetical protein